MTRTSAAENRDVVRELLLSRYPKLAKRLNAIVATEDVLADWTARKDKAHSELGGLGEPHEVS